MREDDVSRPINTPDGTVVVVGGCVTDKKSAFFAKKTLERILKLVKMDVSQTTLAESTARNLALYAIFQGLGQAPIALEHLNAQYSSHVFKQGFQYLHHALHTEAQLQVLINKQLFQLDSNPLLSRKLPCWSCIRLPLLDNKKFVAYQTGITPVELPVYPESIIYCDNRYDSSTNEYRVKVRRSLHPTLILLSDGINDYKYLLKKERIEEKVIEKLKFIVRK